MAGPGYSTAADFGGEPDDAVAREPTGLSQGSRASDFGGVIEAPTEEPGFWDHFNWGVGPAYRGLEEGARKSSLTAYSVLRPLYKLTSSEEKLERMDEVMAAQRKRLEELRRRDEQAGFAANVVSGVAGGALESAGAPAIEAHQRYRDVRAQGGTQASAALSGLATGAVAGVGMAAPGGSSVLGSAISGGFRQAAAGVAQRAIDPVLLSAGGSEDLAKAEKHWSTGDTITDALLGGLFGALHGLGELKRNGQKRITPKDVPEPDEVKIDNKIEALRKVPDPGLHRILDGIEATRATGQVDTKAMLTQLNDLQNLYPHSKPVEEHARDVLARNPKAEPAVNEIMRAQKGLKTEPGPDGKPVTRGVPQDDLWKHEQLDRLERQVKPQETTPPPAGPPAPPPRPSIFDQRQERYQKPKTPWQRMWNRVNAAVPPMSTEQDLLRNTRIAVESGHMTPEEGQQALKSLDDKYSSAWNLKTVNAKMEQLVPEGHPDRAIIEGLRDRYQRMGMTWSQALLGINSILKRHARGEGGGGEEPHTPQRQALERGLDPHKLQDWKDAGLSPKQLEAKLRAWIDEHDVQEHPAPGKEGEGEPYQMDGELRRLLKEATRRGYDAKEFDSGWLKRGVDKTEIKEYLRRWLDWKETDDARNQAMVDRENLWEQYRAGEGLDTHPTLRAAIRARVPSNNKARFMRWLERWTNRRQPAPPRDVSGRLIRQTPEEREALARERPATKYEHLEERPYDAERVPPGRVPEGRGAPEAGAPAPARPAEAAPEPTGGASPEPVQNARGLLDKLDRLAARGKEEVVRAITRGIRTGRMNIDAAHAAADEALATHRVPMAPDTRAPLGAPQTTSYSVDRPTRTYDPRSGFQYWRKKPQGKPPAVPPKAPTEPPPSPEVEAQVRKNLAEIRKGMQEAEDRIKDQMPKGKKKGDWLSRALAKPERWLFNLFGMTNRGVSLAEAREINERVEKDLGKLKLVGEAREVEGLSRTATLLLGKGVPAEPLRIIADMFSSREINATEARLLMNRLLLSLRHAPEEPVREAPKALPAPETGEAKRAREPKEEQEGTRKPLTLQELIAAAAEAGKKPREALKPIEGAKPLGDLEAVKQAAKEQEKKARDEYAKAVGGDPILLATEALQYSLYKTGDRSSAAHQALAKAKVDPNDPVAYHKAVEARKAPLKAEDLKRDKKLERQMLQDVLDNPDPKMGTISDFEDFDEMLDRLWGRFRTGDIEKEPSLQAAKAAGIDKKAKFDTFIEEWINKQREKPKDIEPPPPASIVRDPKAWVEGKKLQPYVKDAIVNGYNDAKGKGLVERIIEGLKTKTATMLARQLFNEGLFGKGVEGNNDSVQAVGAVRAVHEIPSMNEREEFAAWLKANPVKDETKAEPIEQTQSEMRTAMRDLHGAAFANAELYGTEERNVEGNIYHASEWIDRQYQAVLEHMNDLFTVSGQEHRLHDVLDRIAKAPVKAPFVKGLARVLRAYVQDMPVFVRDYVIDPDTNTPIHGMGGLFTAPSEDPRPLEKIINRKIPGAMIQISTKGAQLRSREEQLYSHPVKLLLHETVHAATSRFMWFNPKHPLVVRLRDMQNRLIDDLNRKFQANEYMKEMAGASMWTQNSREIVAYAYTEPGMAKYLGDVDMRAWAQAPRKVFNAFSNILKRIFGLEGQNAAALDDILATGRQIMKLEKEQALRKPELYQTEGGTGRGPSIKDASMNIPPVAKDRFERLMNSHDGIMMRKMWVKAIQKVAPEAKSDQAARAGGIIANAIGKLIQQTVAYAKGSEKRFKYWQFNHEKMLDFLDAMERGATPVVTVGKKWWGPEDTRPATDPEIADMVKHYRQWLNNIWQKDQDKGIEYKYTDHYIPHMFKDADAVAQWMYNYYKPKQWSNPNFTRTRMFETIQQARRAGFELKTNNVEELMLMRQAASDKAHMQIDMLERMADAGLAMTKHAERDVEGKYTRNKPPDWSERRSPAGVMYYVHNDAMAILHNAFDQPGLWGGKDIHDWAYRKWMLVKNYSVPVKLALSLFHPLHVATIDQAQYLALAWKEGMQKGFLKSAPQVADYVKKAAFASLPWIGENNRRGWHLMKLWELDEAARGKVSDTDALALGYMADGGFIPVLSEIHKQQQWNTFERAMRERKYWKGIIAPWAGLDLVQKQAFEKWIPSLKTAAYVSQADQLMRMRPELALDTVERQKAMRQIAKSIDNRYGEMTYDTLFWDKYYKDFGTAMTLSMGWNLGFLREFVPSAGQNIRGIAHVADREYLRQIRSKGQLDKAYFGMAYTLLGLTYAGLMTYFMGGKKVQDMEPKDFFWPVVGHDEDGNEKRVSTMFYNREFGGMWEHAKKEGLASGIWDFVMNKGTGVPGLISDIATGKDEFGRQIMDPNEDEITKFMQELNYVMMDYTPIGIKGTEQSDLPGWRKALPLAGFSAAPKYVTETNTESAIRFAYQQFVSHKVTAYDRALQDRDIDVIRKAWKANDPSVYDLLDKMQAKYNLSDEDIDKVERRLDDPKTAYQNMFQRLGTEGSWQEQKRILDKMTPEEREEFLDYSDAEHLRDNYEPPEDRQ